MEGRSPENEEWIRTMLEKAPEGTPGEISTHEITSKFGRKKKQIVYCDDRGKPISFAIIKERPSLLHDLEEEAKIKWGVEIFVTDKSRGLLGAKAAKKVFDEIFQLDAAVSTGTISPDAINFMYKYLSERVADLSPETYNELGGMREQPSKKSRKHKQK